MRTVLFDVDGTLAETERDGHRVAFNRTFSAAEIDIEWDEPLYSELLLVAGGKQRLEHYFIHHQGMPADRAATLAADLHIHKTAVFVEMVQSGQLDPRPGVKQLAIDLQTQGVPTGIVTTGRRAWVEPLVAHLLGQHVYENLNPVITGDDVSQLKPSPEAYRLAIEKLDIMPHDAIAIEDSVNGVVSAKAAGLFCVAVPSLYNRGHDFSGADLVFPDFEVMTGSGDTGTLLADPNFQKLVFGP